MNEAELVRRLRRGDTGAFDLFFDRYGRPLFGYLRRMVGDRDTAEDLLQETMIRVFRNAARFENRDEIEAGFPAWVYRIATNLALTELRRRHYRTARLHDEASRVRIVGAGPDETLDPHEILEREQETASLERAVEALPDEHRAVLQLRVHAGLGVREVARVLEIPEGTVKSRLHHAVRKLRSALGV